MKSLFLTLLLTTLASADQHYGYAPAPPAPKLYCRPTNTSIYAEVCVPGISTANEDRVLAVKTVEDDKFCYTASQTTCQEVPKVIEREVCTYTYAEKREQAPATTTQVTYDEKSETMKVTSCRPSGYGKPPGYGGHHEQGEHQICAEEYQTQQYRVPLVNVPLEISVELVTPEPEQVCSLQRVEVTETVCEDVSEEKCIDLVKLEDGSVTVQQTEATIGAPDCQQLTLSLPTEVCSKHHGYPH